MSESETELRKALRAVIPLAEETVQRRMAMADKHDDGGPIGEAYHDDAVAAQTVLEDAREALEASQPARAFCDD